MDDETPRRRPSVFDPEMEEVRAQMKYRFRAKLPPFKKPRRRKARPDDQTPPPGRSQQSHITSNSPKANKGD